MSCPWPQMSAPDVYKYLYLQGSLWETYNWSPGSVAEHSPPLPGPQENPEGSFANRITQASGPSSRRSHRRTHKYLWLRVFMN